LQAVWRFDLGCKDSIWSLEIGIRFNLNFWRFDLVVNDLKANHLSSQLMLQSKIALKPFLPIPYFPTCPFFLFPLSFPACSTAKPGELLVKQQC
jgi:hypothetical protein